MTTETGAYIECLERLRNEVKKAIRGMSPEELNWAPLAADTNSACVLVTHIAGSESFWIHQVVGGIDVQRDRDAEFAARGARADELEALLDRVGATSREVLGKLTREDVEQARTTPARMGSRQVSVRWAILHMIEHMGQHLGHLTLTRQLYEARKT